jgi:translation initiation factor 1
MSRLFSGTQFDRPGKCETCGRPAENCICAKNVILPEKKKMSERPGGKHEGRQKNSYELTPENSVAPKDQVAKLRVEKRKGNREVTVIGGLEHPANDLAKLLSILKTKLACGGAVQGRTIELQGDHAKRAAEILEENGIAARVLKL